MLNIIKEKFKKLVNSIRMPSLINLFFKPTIKEALETAPPAKENWVRLGLEKTWLYFVVLGAVLFIYFFKGSLQFLIEIIAQISVLAIISFIGYKIFKSIK